MQRKLENCNSKCCNNRYRNSTATINAAETRNAATVHAAINAMETRNVATVNAAIINTVLKMQQQYVQQQ